MEDCPLITKRIACDKCGYPAGEAMYADIEQWLEDNHYYEAYHIPLKFKEELRKMLIHSV